MRRTLSLVLVLALSGIFLAGCGSKEEETPATNPAKEGSSGATVKGASEVGGGAAANAGDSDRGRG